MRKPIIILTILAVLGILYSIFLHKQSEYIAGEYRYYTAYEKYKAKEKSVAFSPLAYEKDKYNLVSLKDRAKNEIDKLEEFRIELNSVYNLIYKSNNSVANYENYIETLKELSKEIEDNQKYYQWQKNDLTDLNQFIAAIEIDLFSIQLYEEDILHVSSVINSIDSTATKYINSAKLLELASASRGLELLKQIQAEQERNRQELIAQIELERELEKLRKERASNYYSNYSTYSSSNYIDNNNWSNSYNKYSNTTLPTLPNYSSYDIPTFSSGYHSTNTNPNHVQVDGFYKSNGTYVEPYMRTAPNSTLIDNFSTSPNLNPYTGKIGTIKFKQ